MTTTVTDNCVEYVVISCVDFMTNSYKCFKSLKQVLMIIFVCCVFFFKLNTQFIMRTTPTN